MALRRLSIVFALLLAEAAFAAPRTIADCERIEAADAYNRCLASFGPMRGQRGGRYFGAASEPHQATHRAQARGFDMSVERAHKGRVRMVLTPRGGR